MLAWDRSRARIAADPFARRIRVSVAGENKRDILATIRYHFAHIHKTLNDPEVEEMVPCICSKCVVGDPWMFRYSQLRGYSENNIPEIRCDRSFQNVSIERLLTGVYRESELIPKAAASPSEVPVDPGPPVPRPIAKAASANVWASGSFALFVFLVGCAIPAIVAWLYSPWIIPLVILSGITAVCIVGAFQLKQDDRLSDENFLKLMGMSLRQLPALLKSR